MSIGAHLLTRENLELVQKKSWKYGRREIIEKGLGYYDENPKEVARIVENLTYMGLPASGAALDETLLEMAAHYYEKLFVLVKTYEAYWIAKNRVDMGDSEAVYREARDQGKAVFIAQSHFGATYLMGMVLMARGYDISVVGMFPEPVGSMLRKTSDTVMERYGSGSVTFLNLAQPETDAPMEMLRLLHSKKIVSNVFDENNRFCRPQQLLGRSIMGGTGMDRILRSFSDDKVIAVTPFLIRTSDETFRYELDRHSLASEDIIAGFYHSLEKRIKDHPAQWYFIQELHESFVDVHVQAEGTP